MTFHLRLLHLFEVNGHDAERPPASSLAEAPSGGGDAWLRHLDPLHDDSGIDLVCVTGRAAGPGSAAPLPWTTRFLAAMLDRLGLGRDRLFRVPTASSLALLPADSRLANLGCRRELRLPRLPFGVQVISFDPAWLGGGTAGTGRPWLTAAAVDHLACGPLGEPLPGFRVGLLQQPLTELETVPDTARRLADRVDLMLSGGARAIESAGGAAWLTGGTPPGQPTIGWQIITVTCDPSGRPCRIIARLRASTPTAGWRSPGGRSATPAGLRAVPPLRRLAAVATSKDTIGAAVAALAAEPAPEPAVETAVRTAAAAPLTLVDTAARLELKPEHEPESELAPEPGPELEPEPDPLALRVLPSPAVRPGAGMLGEGIAEDCARAVALARRADLLLANGRAEEALRIYREQLLPLHQALAALPSRGSLVHKIAEALERRADPRQT